MVGVSLLIVVSTINFLAFAWAVKRHFASSSVPMAMKFLSAFSVANFVLFVASAWLQPPHGLAITASLLLNLLAFVQFTSAVSYSRSARLKLIFDANQPESVFRGGPFRYIRHPFYGSYIAFWISCAISSPWLSIKAISAALCVTYIASAFREERSFRSSSVAQEYESYARDAGMFFPRLIRARR